LTDWILDKPCSVPLYFMRWSTSYAGRNHLSTSNVHYSSLLSFLFLLRECPYHYLGCSLMGFTRSTRNVSDSHRHCGTFQGLFHISIRDVGIMSRR